MIRRYPPAFRFQVDGWFVNNVGGSTAATAMGRDPSANISAFPDAFIPARGGRITAVSVRTNDARTAGTLTVEVFKNSVATGLTAVLDGTNTTFKATLGSVACAAGDRLELHYSTSSWTPTAADIRGTLELEA